MDRASLKAEVTSDPLGRGYVGMTDQQVADSLNTKNRAVVRPVAPSTQRMWMAGAIHQKIATGVESGPNDTIKGLCRSALLMATTDDDYIRDDHKALLDALVAAGIITQTEADALDDKADKTITRAAELGLPLVGVEHVKKARQ